MRPFVTALIALVAGFAGAAAWDFSGLGARLGTDSTRAALMADPEMLRDASLELQRRDTVARIEPIRSELETPFPGAVLGNPNGSVTLVEFTDYACGYCRASLPDVANLIEANPDLRVVIREYPILSAGSVDAARMALAAAEQGKFAEFHQAMFAAESLSAANIEAAARASGMDVDRAQRAIDMGMFDAQMENNVFLARNLGVSGTPAWVVGDQVLSGAVGPDVIGAAIAEARDS
ncbi:MAG: thioredoxin domain-containing protein [Erythrobacter sp.]|nr:thioredoxin domain-containing protein [Erythrobacter sp.]